MLEIPGILERAHSRRSFLQASGYTALAAALNQRLLVAREASPQQPLRSCILLMLYGGPSQIDTWDMKPHAPSEVRGDYRSIQTSVPGLINCEHLSACAQLMHKLTIIRSMHHDLTNHNSAMYQALVGKSPVSNNEILGANRMRDFPNVGAAISYATARGALPKTGNPLINLALPHVMHNVVDLPGQNSGFLGGSHDPFQINADPNSDRFQVQNLQPPPGISEPRLLARRSLLRSLDHLDVGDSDLEQYQRRAFELLQNPAVQAAFQIEREPPRVREDYGRHKLGQSLLLARRLVESGVRFINVHDGVFNGQAVNWDSHANLFQRHRELLTPFDQGFAALIRDLDQRDLLDSTLVIAMGEFGRTPRVNANGGRDHWPNCYSVVLAGGGVRGGTTFGASDHLGVYPQADPVTPEDLAATIFQRFGINPEIEIRDRTGRPFQLSEGQVIPVFNSRLT
ncbi:hypothetical protein Enr10x_59850 [Gimesia panareensis]|uniref:DUF1501 domain-containing protein n=1 Tax=Gimesia panareensis TaxID=2527978 RepID=A0A517QGE9_9PLAN|nr:DUF1501 domain-containing protein [Gimesia panareensis]QDT30617.1 hypothetical protein Enr10x_59850 [Gimesia panareensis]